MREVVGGCLPKRMLELSEGMAWLYAGAVESPPLVREYRTYLASSLS